MIIQAIHSRRAANWLRVACISSVLTFTYSTNATGLNLFGKILMSRTTASSGIPILKNAKAPKVAVGVPKISVAPTVRSIPFDWTAKLAQPANHSISILNEVGRLRVEVNAAQISEWEGAAKSASNTHSQFVRRLRRAEATLASDQDPVKASLMFSKLLIDAHTDPVITSLVRRDLGFCAFFQGEYDLAEKLFRDMIASRHPGIDSIDLTGFLGHARACAGYHKNRELLGIIEPGKIDPLCGVRSLAYCAQRLGLAESQKDVGRLVKHTGFGSDLNDITTGARALGLIAVPLHPTQEIMTANLGPMIAHVEHDHFIALVEANATGVVYWCFDCGGQQRVTWSQWNALECDALLTLAKPGSEAGQIVMAALDQRAGGLLAVVTPHASSALVAAVAKQSFLAPLSIICGFAPESLQCACQVSCPKIGGHMIISTGEEEHDAGVDLHIYNPNGPSVSWGAQYGSLRRPLDNGFGNQWTHPYNICVTMIQPSRAPAVQPAGPPPTGASMMDIVLPNSGHIKYSSLSTPDATHPCVECTTNSPTEWKMTWNYDIFVAKTYFLITTPDRTVMRTTFGVPVTANSGYLFDSAFMLERITDRNGHSLSFTYSPVTHDFGGRARVTNFPILTGISNDQGLILLNLTLDANGYYNRASDCYGRTVNYRINLLSNTFVVGDFPQVTYQLSQISQLNSASLRKSYAYAPITNMEGGETVARLTQVASVSPTGVGMSSHQFEYDSSGFIHKEIDANGNTIELAPPTAAVSPGTANKIIFKDSAGVVQEQFTSVWDGYMTEVARYDGTDRMVWTKSMGSANAHRPSSITDGNGRSWSFTWDQYYHMLTETTPKGTVTSRVYDFTVNPLGELTQVQEGVKTPTNYLHGLNGLVTRVSSPVPGSSGQQDTTFRYDGLGNVTSVTSPGNNAGATRTVQFNYTSDGTYSQSAKVGQILRMTDPLGKVTHMRYDALGNLTSTVDALGNESMTNYNIASQPLVSTIPATGNTGNFRSGQSTSYLFPGGPAVQMDAFDESGSVARSVAMRYGPAGELLSRTGSTEDISLTYTGTYKTKTLSDGNRNQTNYSYNLNGQPVKLSYPGATTGTSDTMTFDQYDAVGNLLQRTDGNGRVTSYTYADLDGLLTQVACGGSTPGISLQYDNYDRINSLVDGTGQSLSEYDDLNLLRQSTRIYTNLPAFKVVMSQS